MKNKDILGLKNLDPSEITLILDTAQGFKKLLNQGVKKLPHLQGKTVTTLFYENSTRTRTSFELAAKYMSANTVNLSVGTSSVVKGESLIDTGMTLDAMKNDVIIIRHPMSGSAALLASTVKCSVINGGDGINEHPTQALLDMLSMREKYGTFKNLKVAIIGDIKHSRVAKSNIYGLIKMGAEVSIFGPRTLMLPDLKENGAKIAGSREEAVRDADVVMGLRLQLERQAGGLFPTLAEYAQFYGVNDDVMKHAKKDALIMHPGPVNRGVELSSGVIDGEQSMINDQVLSGVAVRMALLYLLTKADK